MFPALSPITCRRRSWVDHSNSAAERRVVAPKSPEFAQQVDVRRQEGGVRSGCGTPPGDACGPRANCLTGHGWARRASKGTGSDIGGAGCCRESRCRDGHRLRGGDEFELVLEGSGERTGEVPASPRDDGSMRHEVSGRIGVPQAARLAAMSSRADRRPARQPMVDGHRQHPRLVIAEDRFDVAAGRRGTAAGSRPRRLGGRVARCGLALNPGAGLAHRRRGARGATGAPPG